jgi:xanthine dehydrogenase YagS FAD-binding subunit
MARKSDESAYREAAEIVIRGTKPYPHNAFKVELACRSIVRALATVSQMA